MNQSLTEVRTLTNAVHETNESLERLREISKALKEKIVKLGGARPEKADGKASLHHEPVCLLNMAMNNSELLRRISCEIEADIKELESLLG